MRCRALLATAGLLAVAGSMSLGLVMTEGRGTWPKNWPKELEPLRQRATTYDIAAGNQEIAYYIPFTDRDEFERLWPAILKVKDKGGTLTLCSTMPDNTAKNLFKTSKPAVRIAGPAGGIRVKFRGMDDYISTGPPWPASLYDENGQLPEYVDWDGEQWVGVKLGAHTRGFIYRARVDITLIVDGQVIDLNRIRLPADTLVIDRRNLPSDEDYQPPTTSSAPASEPAEEEGGTPGLP